MGIRKALIAVRMGRLNRRIKRLSVRSERTMLKGLAGFQVCQELASELRMLSAEHRALVDAESPERDPEVIRHVSGVR